MNSGVWRGGSIVSFPPRSASGLSSWSSSEPLLKELGLERLAVLVVLVFVQHRKRKRPASHQRQRRSNLPPVRHRAVGHHPCAVYGNPCHRSSCRSGRKHCTRHRHRAAARSWRAGRCAPARPGRDWRPAARISLTGRLPSAGRRRSSARPSAAASTPGGSSSAQSRAR